MKTKLYVGNLSKTTTEEDLNTLFAQVGTVNSVELLSVGPAESLKCFAFVEMENRPDADHAIAKYNGFSLNHRTIKVNLARPREARPDGGGWYQDPHPPTGSHTRKSASRRKSS